MPHRGDSILSCHGVSFSRFPKRENPLVLAVQLDSGPTISGSTSKRQLKVLWSILATSATSFAVSAAASQNCHYTTIYFCQILQNSHLLTPNLFTLQRLTGS
jgi:hypothetical protein